jgi:hypothetical protein
MVAAVNEVLANRDTNITQVTENATLIKYNLRSSRAVFTVAEVSMINVLFADMTFNFYFVLFDEAKLGTKRVSNFHLGENRKGHLSAEYRFMAFVAIAAF